MTVCRHRSARCHSFVPFLTYFLSSHSSRFSFYINNHIVIFKIHSNSVLLFTTRSSRGLFPVVTLVILKVFHSPAQLSLKYFITLTSQRQQEFKCQYSQWTEGFIFVYLFEKYPPTFWILTTFYFK